MQINRFKIDNIVGENVSIEDNSLVYNGVKIGANSRVLFFANLYGCDIGSNCMIGSYVEIQAGAKLGNGVKVGSHTFICDGVTIGNKVFLGHGVMFINDNHPVGTKQTGELEKMDDWQNRFVRTIIEDDVKIGSNVTILGGLTIGKGALIGAGAVVTKNVPAGETWVGNPARKIEKK